MKSISIFGIILSLVMFCVGIAFPVPKKDVYVGYGYEHTWFDNEGSEYVGGDAYNYQMEASLKAGWVAGVMALKAISTSTGILLFILSIAHNAKIKELEEQTHILKTIASKLPENLSVSNKQDEKVNDNLPAL